MVTIKNSCVAFNNIFNLRFDSLPTRNTICAGMQSSLVKPNAYYFFIVTSYLLISAKLHEVELYSNVAAILRRVGGVPALFWKIDINRSAVHISICLHQSE